MRTLSIEISILIIRDVAESWFVTQRGTSAAVNYSSFIDFHVHCIPLPLFISYLSHYLSPKTNPPKNICMSLIPTFLWGEAAGLLGVLSKG